MSWDSTTTWGTINSSSSMGAGTALSRSVTTTPANVTVTSYHFRCQIDDGAGSGSYTTFTTGQLARFSSWVIGLSWVPTGTSVPSLATDGDNPVFQFVDDIVDGRDRQTINTAGTPSYKDLFTWTLVRRGRMQIRTTVTGAFYLHIFNTDSTTHVTGWRCTVRGTYASIV